MTSASTTWTASKVCVSSRTTTSTSRLSTRRTEMLVGGYWNNGKRFGGRFDRYRGQDSTASSTRIEGGRWTYQNGRNMGGEIRKKIISWDVAPGQDYFEELFRVSRNQVIWGGNYFHLPPTRGFLIWRKTNVPHDFSMAMAEYAWMSFQANAKVFDYSAVGQDGRFHPTQKPVALYKWILSNYAKPGDKILDTHVGSASSLIACYDMGFDSVGFEIDEEYYRLASKRLEEEMAQIRFTF